jgi:hypothetical protein
VDKRVTGILLVARFGLFKNTAGIYDLSHFAQFHKRENNDNYSLFNSFRTNKKFNELNTYIFKN